MSLVREVGEVSPAEAQTLRDSGLSYREIGERAGVVPSTVRRWLNPEAAERNRQASREAKRRRRQPCEDCGGPKSYDCADNPCCAECQHEREYAERNAAIIDAWERGVPTAGIAAEHGMRESAVRDVAGTSRRRHGRSVSLRRRRNRELWPEIERRWKAGATAVEIAGALDATAYDVRQMLRRMRGAGIDLPRRGPAPIPPERKRAIIDAYLSGERLSEIAERFGYVYTSSLAGQLAAWRKRGDDIPYRRTP